MTWLMIETVGLIATIFFLLYYYSMSRMDYWRKRGVKGPKPLPFLGNFKDVFLAKESTMDCFERAYKEFKDEPIIGVYGGHEPLLILRDLDLIKDVLIKDFNKFAQRTHGAIREVRIKQYVLIRMSYKVFFFKFFKDSKMNEYKK